MLCHYLKKELVYNYENCPFWWDLLSVLWADVCALGYICRWWDGIINWGFMFMLLSGWHIMRCSKANPSEIDPVSFSMFDVSFSIELEYALSIVSILWSICFLIWSSSCDILRICDSRGSFLFSLSLLCPFNCALNNSLLSLMTCLDTGVCWLSSSRILLLDWSVSTMSSLHDFGLSSLSTSISKDL